MNTPIPCIYPKQKCQTHPTTQPACHPEHLCRLAIGHIPAVLTTADVHTHTESRPYRAAAEPQVPQVLAPAHNASLPGQPPDVKDNNICTLPCTTP
jgi:hypothetical protein